ncbi:endo alpha-1,4 polygalactosaminidase [Aneurinibacillus sp. BA2021]|nr:endo alpha-1,4 polygalactosaminidase [Aneurinibacillus sp. BA2021]
MRKLTVAMLVLSLILFGIGGSTTHVSAANPSPFQNVTSYKIFYGKPTTRIFSEMKNYNLVIVEPYQYTKAEVERIKKGGTMVIGYVSAMEVAAWNQTLLNKCEPADFFLRNNEKVHFTEWDSYLMDITSPHYQQVLLDEVRNQVAAKGFDGVFLDTVGDIDDQHGNDPVMLTLQQFGMATVMSEIKAQFPGLYLIQNWGFGTLANYTAPYVDGFMWENFEYTVVAKDQWAQDRIAELHALQQKYAFSVFTVSFNGKAKSTDYANKQGFIHFHTTKGFDVW